MALFALMAMFFTGLGPVMMSWVEVRPDLGWRYVFSHSNMYQASQRIIADAQMDPVDRNEWACFFSPVFLPIPGQLIALP